MTDAVTAIVAEPPQCTLLKKGVPKSYRILLYFIQIYEIDASFPYRMVQFVGSGQQGLLVFREASLIQSQTCRSDVGEEKVPNLVQPGDRFKVTVFPK